MCICESGHWHLVYWNTELAKGRLPALQPYPDRCVFHWEMVSVFGIAKVAASEEWAVRPCSRRYTKNLIINYYPSTLKSQWPDFTFPQVDSSWSSRQYDEARHSAKTAKILNIVGFAIGISAWAVSGIVVIIYLIYIFAVVGTVASSRSASSSI